MTIEPDQIRTQIEALLADLGELDTLDEPDSLDQLTHRLEQAHDLLVHALESVEKG